LSENPENDVWFQNVAFNFVPYAEFEKLDNEILKELLGMSERVKEEPIAFVALTVAFVEKYVDVLVRWYAKKQGKKLHDILKNHQGSPFHVFRKAAMAEGLISEAFNEMSEKIYNLRDKMIHFDEEELGAMGATIIVPKSGPVTVTGPGGITFERQDYEPIRRPLRKIAKSEQLKTISDGIKRCEAIVDIYFTNMVSEIKVLKIVNFET
jgi:hypothetical protein